MLYLLYGPDSFTKKEYFENLAESNSAELLSYTANNLPIIEELLAPNLFAKHTVYILQNCLTVIDAEKDLEKLKKSSNIFVLAEDKLDKRTKLAASLLKDKNIQSVLFNAPSIHELPNWIKDRLEKVNSSIESEALSELLSRIIPDQSRFGFEGLDPDLWQLTNELKKLAVYSQNKPITLEAVKALTPQTVPTIVWDIINAVSEKNRSKLAILLEQYLQDQSGGDDKAKIIQLNSALAEQFRGMAISLDAKKNNIPDLEILEATGWKQGRLFMVNKNAKAFELKKVLEVLKKLEALDEELKTTSVPPRVMVDLILSQI